MSEEFKSEPSVSKQERPGATFHHVSSEITRREVKEYTDVLDQDLLDWMKLKEIKFNTGIIWVIVDGKMQEMLTDQDNFGRFLEDISSAEDNTPAALLKSSHPALNVTKEEVKQFASKLDKNFLKWMKRTKLRFNSGLIDLFIDGQWRKMQTNQDDFGTFIIDKKEK